MTRRTEGPWAARKPAPREVVRCECGELTHEADGVCSRYCREKQAQELEMILAVVDATAPTEEEIRARTVAVAS